MSEALNYKGIRSDIALAATFNHISDCDFPSLCSANHVVSVVYPDNKPVVLDPTDPIHLPGLPVQGIQERTILIINPEGGAYFKPERFAPQNNMINYEIKLQVNSEKSVDARRV